jgi:hypothetical protein
VALTCSPQAPCDGDRKMAKGLYALVLFQHFRFCAHRVPIRLDRVRLMRQYGQETTLPSYRQIFFRAASELEARASMQATVLPENWSTPAEDAKLHQRLDLKV